VNRLIVEAKLAQRLQVRWTTVRRRRGEFLSVFAQGAVTGAQVSLTPVTCEGGEQSLAVGFGQLGQLSTEVPKVCQRSVVTVIHAANHNRQHLPLPPL